MSLRKLQPGFLLLGLLAAVVVTFPLIFRITTHLPGSELIGPYSHTWKIWWTYQALFHLGTNPAHSSLINYPAGLAVGYYLANFMNGIWAIPWTHLLGPVAGINIVVLLSTASGCWAASVLATRVGLSRAQAAFVGLSWSLCPHHLGFLMGGGIEYMAVPWVPLSFLAIIKLLHPLSPPDTASSSRGHRAAMAVGLALCLFLTGMTTWFNGMVLTVFCGMFLLVLLTANRFRIRGGAVWALGGMLIGCLAVFLAAHSLLPLMKNGDQEISFENARVILLNRSWIRDLPLATIAESDDLWINNHVLITLVILALLGCLHRRGRRCFLLGLPFFLDLLVPFSRLFTIKSPLLAQYPSVISIANLIGLRPDTRIFLMHLVLSLCAGFGIAWLQQRLTLGSWKGWARFLPLIALSAWGIELARECPVKLPVSIFHARIPPHTSFLAGATRGAVIDVPLMMDGQSYFTFKATHSKYLFYQTAHGHPIIAAVGTRLGHAREDLPIKDAAVDLFMHPGPATKLDLPAGWTPGELLKNGFRWVVLHRWLVARAYRDRLTRKLREVFGEPRSFEGGRVLVFFIHHTGVADRRSPL